MFVYWLDRKPIYTNRITRINAKAQTYVTEDAGTQQKPTRSTAQKQEYGADNPPVSVLIMLLLLCALPKTDLIPYR